MARTATSSVKFARKPVPKAGAMRTAADQPDEQLGSGAGGDLPKTGSAKDQLVKDTLGKLCNERIKEARMAREASGIEDEWREARDLYFGHDEVNTAINEIRIPDKRSGPKRSTSDGSQSTILVNITKPKTKTIVSRIKEMLVPTNDKPWDAKPTPIPDFDKVANDPQLAQQLYQVGDGTMAPAGAIVQIARDKAAEATRGEVDWIEDRLVEGHVYAELRKVIEDAGLEGTGCIKGPFPVVKKTREWKIDGSVAKMIVNEIVTPTSRRIRIDDAFPDPACGDNIHAGSYFNEREFATPRELRRMAEDPAYDQVAIAEALLEGPMSAAMEREGGTRERRKSGDMVRDSALFTLWHCYGDCTPEALIAMGVKDALLGNLPKPTAANDEPDYDDAPGGKDAEGAEAAFDPDGGYGKRGRDPALTREQKAALASIPACVTMLNGRPIKAYIEPLESGEFPFDFFRLEKVEGQPWGRGAPMQMRAAQLIVKQSIRRLLENSGLSAGAQVAITDGALTPYDGKYVITGKKLWRFTPTELVNDINKAMAIFEIESKQQELMAVVQLGLDLADRLTNIPMLMQGDQQEGTAPETLGGLKLFENNAMSPLRDVAKIYDDDLMLPHIGRYHEWFMTHVPDKPKGDTDIQALGSTALIQREEGRLFLMALAPVKTDPDWRIDPAKYSKELGRANGYDMSLIQYSDADWKKHQQQLAQQQPPVSDTVQAAKVRADSAEKIAGEKAQIDMTAEHARQVHEENDRALRVQELQLKKQELDLNERIAMLNYGAKMGVSLDQIKAQLAIAAAAEASRRDEMQLKLNPENPSHTGI